VNRWGGRKTEVLRPGSIAGSLAGVRWNRFRVQRQLLRNLIRGYELYIVLIESLHRLLNIDLRIGEGHGGSVSPIFSKVVFVAKAIVCGSPRN
jgi:hypothetical protein